MNGKGTKGKTLFLMLLTFILCASSLVTFAVATDIPMEAVAGTVDTEGKVEVRLVAKQSFEGFSLQVQADVDRLEEQGITLEEIAVGADLLKPSGSGYGAAMVFHQQDVPSGTAWAHPAKFDSNVTVPADAEFMVYTFDVSKAAAGSYTVDFALKAGSVHSVPLPWSTESAKVTATLLKPGAAPAPTEIQAPDSLLPTSQGQEMVTESGLQTVHFETNTDLSVEDAAVEQGQTAVLPEIERDGYIFEGWYTDEALTQPASSTSYQPQGNATLYAKWKPVSDSEYVVKFDVDGGERITPVSAEKGGQVLLPTPAKEGYQFEGWYEDEARTDAVEGDYVPSSNATLYAKWKELESEKQPVAAEAENTQEQHFPIVLVAVAGAVVVAAAICAAVVLVRHKKGNGAVS